MQPQGAASLESAAPLALRKTGAGPALAVPVPAQRQQEHVFRINRDKEKILPLIAAFANSCGGSLLVAPERLTESEFIQHILDPILRDLRGPEVVFVPHGASLVAIGREKLVIEYNVEPERGIVEFNVHPLPWGSIALPSHYLPQVRQGPHPVAKMSVKDLIARLRAIDLASAVQLEDKDPSSYVTVQFVNHNRPELGVGSTSVSGGLSETSVRENKCPSKANIFLTSARFCDFVKDHLTSSVKEHMTGALLNAEPYDALEGVQLWVGIHDQEGAIGFSLDGTDPISEESLRKRIVESIAQSLASRFFPSPHSACKILVQFWSVAGTAPPDWLDRAVVLALPQGAELDLAIPYAFFVALRGEAAYTHAIRAEEEEEEEEDRQHLFICNRDRLEEARRELSVARIVLSKALAEQKSTSAEHVLTPKDLKRDGAAMTEEELKTVVRLVRGERLDTGGVRCAHSNLVAARKHLEEMKDAADVVSETHWQHLDETHELYPMLSQLQRRQVAQVQVCGIPPASRLFLPLSNGLTKVPLDAPLGCFDPLALWLRVCARNPLSAELLDGLQSDMYVRVAVGLDEAQIDQELIPSLRRAVPGHQVVFHATLAAKTSFTAPAILQARRAQHRLLLFVLGSETAVNNLFLADRMCDVFYSIVLLVPPSCLTSPTLRKDVGQVMNRLGVNLPWVHLRFCDVRLLGAYPPLSSHPWPAQPVMREGTAASLEEAGEPAHETQWYSLVHTASQMTDEEVFRQGREWMQRKLQIAPPWELAEHGLLLETPQSKQMVRFFRQLASSTDRTRCSTAVFTAYKLFSGIGATSATRSAAYALRLEYHVVWVTRMPRNTQEITDLSRQAAEGGSVNILFVIDETPNPSAFWSLVQSAAFPDSVHRVCLLVVRPKATPLSASVATSLVFDPFLSPNDFHALGQQLLIVYKDDAASTAAVQAAMKAVPRRNSGLSSESLYSRHIFVLCLAAAKGHYEPAVKWVQELHDQLLARPNGSREHARLYDVAFLVAFAASFLHKDDAGVPLKLALVHTQSPLPAHFFELFTEGVTEAGSSEESAVLVSLHPLFARLFVSAALPRITWSVAEVAVPAYCEALSRCRRTINATSLGEEFAGQFARTLFLVRVGPAWFSRLVTLMLHRGLVTSDGLRDPMPDVVGLLKAYSIPVKPRELVGHINIMLARCHGALARRLGSHQETRFSHLDEAVKRSRRACQHLDGTEQQFVATQNLAVQLRNASLPQLGHADRLRATGTEALDLLERLFQSCEKERRHEVIAIALTCPGAPEVWSERETEYGSQGNEDLRESAEDGSPPSGLYSALWRGVISNSMMFD